LEEGILVKVDKTSRHNNELKSVFKSLIALLGQSDQKVGCFSRKNGRFNFAHPRDVLQVDIFDMSVFISNEWGGAVVTLIISDYTRVTILKLSIFFFIIIIELPA